MEIAEAEKRLQESGISLESSSKELEERMEWVTEQNQQLKRDNERLNEELKKSEASVAHQIKVTKNLELVLDRLQNDQNNQNSLEIKEYQRTIKDQSVQIFNLQREIKSHQV